MPPLTEVKLKALKPKATLYRVADERGLCIEVTTTGTKHWRYRYRWLGKATMLSLGEYPLITLAEARLSRDDARRLLIQGTNPADKRRQDMADRQRVERGMFPVVAKEWLEHKRKSVGDETYRKAKLVVEGDLIPALRRQSITTMATKDVLRPLQKVADRAPHLAAKARQYLTGIVDYAIKHGLRDDGKLLSLRGAVPTLKKGHIAAITKPGELGPLLKAIDGYASPLTRDALKLASLTAMRPAIIASARWEHITIDDEKTAEWHVPGSMMKAGFDHIVPLPTQAVALLRALQKITGGGDHVFPSPARQKTPHLHRDALSKALRDMGFQGKHATHGFRGTLRTMARERLNVDMDVLEAQLAHAKRGDVAKAYDRTTFDDERRRVMQAWADYLDVLRLDDKKVVPLRAAGAA